MSIFLFDSMPNESRQLVKFRSLMKKWMLLTVNERNSLSNTAISSDLKRKIQTASDIDRVDATSKNS